MKGDIEGFCERRLGPSLRDWSEVAISQGMVKPQELEAGADPGIFRRRGAAGPALYSRVSGLQDSKEINVLF